jgi:transposase
MAPALLARAGPLTQLIARRAYDANSPRSALRQHGAEAVIPSTRSRKRPIPYDPIAYKQRNVIEPMFGHLKDFRRIGTRYEKLAQSYLAAAILAATVTWWIN